MDNHTNELLSQSEVARLANIPQPKFIRLVKAGKIIPDFRNGKTLLFLPSRVDSIKADLGK